MKIEFGIDPKLQRCFQEIAHCGARKLALEVLRAEGSAVDGLMNAARICKWSMNSLKSTPLPKGHKALMNELEELAQYMDETASRLGKLSPTALEWIGILPFAGIAGPQMPHPDKRVAPMFQKWIEAGASEAFPVQNYVEGDDGAPWFMGPKPKESHLAHRLGQIADVLKFLALMAQEAKGQSPNGTRQVFAPPPADCGIFVAVAGVLRSQGRSLVHLRPIACAIYQWGTGNVPSESWSIRQEAEARATHPMRMG